MIRIVIENFLLFLLPTFIYVAWVIMTKKNTPNTKTKAATPADIFADAPVLWLFASGAVLVVVTLIAFGSTSGGKPGQRYEPSSIKDGQIKPGHIE
jgi:Family of unknown function (DUF6111)